MTQRSDRPPLRPRYPDTRRADAVEQMHGVEVPDPYRWLEESDDPEVETWVERQQRLTEDWLDAHTRRARVREQLYRLWDFAQYGIPFREGDRYFYSYNPGLLNQSQLMTAPSLEAEPTLLLDPNLLAADGTRAVAGYTASPDGRYLAYAVADAGSDWKEWRVRDIATGRDTVDRVPWSKFSAASWRRDASGFYYGCYDPPQPGAELTAPNYFHKLRFHRLGTNAATDELVFERPDEKEWGFHAIASWCGAWLVIEVTRGTDPCKQLFVLSLASGRLTEMFAGFDAAYQYVGNEGSRFFVSTDREAPRGRVLAVDLDASGGTRAHELIGEREDALEAVTRVGDRLLARYLHDVTSRVRIHELDGRHTHDVELPANAAVDGLHGDPDSDETFFAVSRFTEPLAIYRYDVVTGDKQLFRQIDVSGEHAPLVTRQVFVTSRDGTRVPMFLSHRFDLKPGDGGHPTFLYGYGGFNVSLQPSYSPTMRLWMERGGVWAVANLRGGSEYGEQWHQQGRGARKQNVFDDFIAAAEHLIADGMTSPDRLTIGGGSNGGLLTGACLTQRPDLYAGVFIAQPVLDMLRYHRFTIGWAWMREYGDPDDPDDFQVLKAYSPLHRVAPARYPATLIATSDHDDRVVPAHAYKFAAALQTAQTGDAPILLRIDRRAGHGEGKPLGKVIEEHADRLAFLSAVVGLDLR